MNKDISASEVSGNKVSDHIVEVNDMVKIGSSTERVMDNGRAYLAILQCRKELGRIA